MYVDYQGGRKKQKERRRRRRTRQILSWKLLRMHLKIEYSLAYLSVFWWTTLSLGCAPPFIGLELLNGSSFLTLKFLINGCTCLEENLIHVLACDWMKCWCMDYPMCFDNFILVFDFHLYDSNSFTSRPWSMYLHVIGLHDVALPPCAFHPCEIVPPMQSSHHFNFGSLHVTLYHWLTWNFCWCDTWLCGIITTIDLIKSFMDGDLMMSSLTLVMSYWLSLINLYLISLWYTDFHEPICCVMFSDDWTLVCEWVDRFYDSRSSWLWLWFCLSTRNPNLIFDQSS